MLELVDDPNADDPPPIPPCSDPPNPGVELLDDPLEEGLGKPPGDEDPEDEADETCEDSEVGATLPGAASAEPLPLGGLTAR